MTYQLQGRVAENPSSTILPPPTQGQAMSLGGRRTTEDSTCTVIRPYQSAVGELDTLSTTAMNLATKFKFAQDSATLSEEMKAFIDMFKNKRMTLGYTQEDVGLELSQRSGPTYSQSFISRFESKQLAAKASEKMRPILQAWLDAKDVDQTTGARLCKKRRRRTSFTNDSLAILVESYQRNPKPNSSEIAELAAQLKMEPVTVKVWFCNRKQSERRRSLGLGKNSATLKSELEASTNKELVRTGNEQIASYGLGRLQPLMAGQDASPVTMLDTDVQYQTGVTHGENNTSLNQAPSYTSDANVQFQSNVTVASHDENNTPLTQALPYSAPVVVMETEVPTTETANTCV